MIKKGAGAARGISSKALPAGEGIRPNFESVANVDPDPYSIGDDEGGDSIQKSSQKSKAIAAS